MARENPTAPPGDGRGAAGGAAGGAASNRRAERIAERVGELDPDKLQAKLDKIEAAVEAKLARAEAAVDRRNAAAARRTAAAERQASRRGPGSTTVGKGTGRGKGAKASGAQGGGKAAKGAGRSGHHRSGDDLADKVVAKLERMEEVLDQSAARQEVAARRAEERAQMLDRLANRLGALDVWLREQPGARKPRFTRDDIAEAALRICDEGGVGALSMRHLAAVLDAGTMTLYHYVRTKDELLTLVNDAVMGEVVVPDDEPWPDSWKDAVIMIATRSRDAFRNHPWLFDITDDPPIGPNSMRHFDQSLRAVSPLDLPLADRLDIVLSVDEYVFGFCLHERNNLTDDPDVLDEGVRAYVEQLLGEGAYPELQRIVDDLGADAVFEAVGAHHLDAHRFERNLRRILDGFEADFGQGR